MVYLILSLQDLISLVNAILGSGRIGELNGYADISYIKSDDDYLEKCFNAISSGINIFQFRSPYFSMRKKRYY